ncbi:hypothetical protein KUTeg_024114 [Tegillarca granosa]|uniref:MCMDC2 N-terminal domain-containing protein n=1 Tax=Tegillarca granosa TaxID=220873 RepID=A0ABQ9E2S3_TEGGR|nr:hypothetical protein KUTeg_024114 [Tegillarca granosa]
MEELNSKYRLIKSILEYIDTSENLIIIKETCEKYKRQRCFGLYIQVVSLGNDLLKSPSTVSLLFQEIIIELKLLSDDITLSQISVILRLSSLPAGLSMLEVKSCKNLSQLCDNYTGFVRLTGIIIGVTATSKYTQSTRYICQDTECEGNHGNHFIRVHTPGASESQTIRNDFKCVFCWKTLTEVKTCRTLADRVVADFIPDTVLSKALSSKGGQICFREQAIPVYVEGHSPLHILAVGQDTEILHKLLIYGQTYAHRSCTHTTGKHLSGKVTTDKYDRAPYFVEGGSFLLARNGICYFGDLGKYRKTTCDILQTVLGNNKILIDIGSKYTGGLPQQLDVQLQCNVWSYTNPTSQNKKPVAVDDVFTGCKTGDISKTFGFSMVQFVDCDDSTTNEEIALQCAYQHLKTAVQVTTSQSYNENIVTEEDFRQFITHCQSLTVRVTDEADRVIQGYYVASRKARSYSVLSVRPTQHFSVNEIEQTLGPQNDNSMQQFHIQLLRFCTSQSTSEE